MTVCGAGPGRGGGLVVVYFGPVGGAFGVRLATGAVPDVFRATVGHAQSQVTFTHE